MGEANSTPLSQPEAHGLKRDYLLAFGSLDNYVRRIKNDEPPRLKNLARRAFLHRAFKKYTDFFSNIPPEQLITNQNRGEIEKIDAIVDQLNMLREQGDVDYEILAPLWDAVQNIIYGRFPKGEQEQEKKEGIQQEQMI